MSVRNFLDRLTGVRKTGDVRWIACCPAHQDRTPSLAIRELDDGRVLLHCFAGCDPSSVLNAVGLTFADLFPRGALKQPEKRIHRPFSPMDVLRCVAFEAHIAAVAASNIAQGAILTAADHARLTQAAARLHRAAEAVDA